MNKHKLINLEKGKQITIYNYIHNTNTNLNIKINLY